MSEYDDDDDLDDSPSEARDRFRRKVSTEGLRVAYDTALGICRDAKAPAPAKATAVVALMRAAGAFERRKDEDDDTPLTSAQRLRHLAELGKIRDDLQAIVNAPGDNDVFG